MRFIHLVIREIIHRKMNFLLGVVAATVAVAGVIGPVLILRGYDASAEHIMAAKEEQTKARLDSMKDDIRKITKNLGFNVLILPRDQNLSDLYARDYATNSMPEEYVERLAKSKVATIQHLLPSLQQKLTWPETERSIILIGVRGEVPITHADPKKPILEPVPAGTMTVGWELHRSLRLQKGARVKLLGRQFVVGKLQPERGTKDDITIWINLAAAQELLGQKGRINGILALECVCAADSLDRVRTEIGRVLPDTQIIEFQSQTLARAEARKRAEEESIKALEHEKAGRARLQQTRESLAAISAPLSLLISGIWIGFLAFSNVRERRPEIGLLRALGVGGRTIMCLFLTRAVMVGLLGGILGYLGGFSAACLWPDEDARHSVSFHFDPMLALLSLAGAPLLALVAAWLPSFMAAEQDPAEVLNQE